MKTSSRRTPRKLVLSAVLLASIFSLPAQAIVGGSGVDANTSSSPWSGVVSISNDAGTFSGVLIGSNYVLTAAHVVASNITVNFNTGSSQSIAAASVTVFPGFNGTTAGSDGLWHDDLALIKLSSPAPADAIVYGLYSGAPTPGATMTMVGYGATGNGITGETAGGSATVKNVGGNRIDRLVPDDDSSGPGFTGTNEIIIFDFDDPADAKNVFTPSTGVLANEAQFGGGDSGSPLFVTVNGQTQLIGIASFNGIVNKLVDGVEVPNSTSTTTFGSIGGATSVAAYGNWINSVMAVPEPGTYAMLLAGLCVIGVVARRR